MPNFKKSKNKMDSPYNLKPVPEGDRGKGLSKLPTEVRNKMGYEMKPYKMDSSHAFKMGNAENMKTMYMGSTYSMDPNKKKNTNFEITALDPKIFDDLRVFGNLENRPGHKNMMSNYQPTGANISKSDIVTPSSTNTSPANNSKIKTMTGKSDKSFGELFLSNLTFGAINKGNAKIRQAKRANRRNKRKNK